MGLGKNSTSVVLGFYRIKKEMQRIGLACHLRVGGDPVFIIERKVWIPTCVGMTGNLKKQLVAKQRY